MVDCFIRVCLFALVSFSLRERSYPFLCLIAPRNHQMTVIIRVEGKVT